MFITILIDITYFLITFSFIYYFYCRNKEQRGIFPKSYIHLCDYKIVNGEYCIQRTEIVEEITKVLLEWGSILKQYFLVSTTTTIMNLF